MLSKLSIIFNLALAYVVTTLHEDAKTMNLEIISCHAKKYDDLNNLMVRLNYLKGKVSDDLPSSQIKEEIDHIVNQQRAALNKPAETNIK